MHAHTRSLAWAAAGIFAVGAVTGWTAPALLQVGAAAPAANVAAAVNTTPAMVPAMVPGGAPNYRAIVAANGASVVGITTASALPVAASGLDGANGDRGDLGDLGDLGDEGDSNGGGNDPFRFFFPDGQGPRRAGPMHAQGSGFIVSADGLILTNAHVVDGAKLVTVKLMDHREFKARVLGTDKSSDLAVLKIDAHDLRPVRLGDSDQLAVGDYVLAIGAPFGLEETATAGIVSAKGRSLPGDGYVPFIQTDAAVNPGNSGGPLFDAGGAVVGINSQIYSNSGGYQGVAFAIPINLAEQVKDQLVASGRVAHGRLGIEVQNLDQSLADSFGVKTPAGALVAKVEAGGAGERAGLQSGDVIVQYDGAAITDAGQLSARVNMTAPGSTATLQIVRHGEPMTLKARVGSAAELTAAVPAAAASERGALGLQLRELTPQEREQAGVPGGLVVESAQGRAADAGIQPGDLVLSVDGTQLRSVAQLRDLVRSHDKQVALLIQRGAGRLFVPVGLG
jgi:serine protease Do